VDTFGLAEGAVRRPAPDNQVGHVETFGLAEGGVRRPAPNSLAEGGVERPAPNSQRAPAARGRVADDVLDECTVTWSSLTVSIKWSQPSENDRPLFYSVHRKRHSEKNGDPLRSEGHCDAFSAAQAKPWESGTRNTTHL
jgi:hypothetical protein